MTWSPFYQEPNFCRDNASTDSTLSSWSLTTSQGWLRGPQMYSPLVHHFKASLSLFCVTMPSSQVRQGILGKCNFCSNHKNYHLPGPHSHIVWKAPHCVSPPPQKNMSSVLSDILFTIRSMIFVQFQLNMDKRQTWTIEWKEANQSWSKLRQINKSSPQKNKQSTTPSKTSIRVF